LGKTANLEDKHPLLPKSQKWQEDK